MHAKYGRSRLVSLSLFFVAPIEALPVAIVSTAIVRIAIVSTAIVSIAIVSIAIVSLVVPIEALPVAAEGPHARREARRLLLDASHGHVVDQRPG